MLLLIHCSLLLPFYWGSVLDPCIVIQVLWPCSFAIASLEKRELVALIVFLMSCDC